MDIPSLTALTGLLTKAGEFVGVIRSSKHEADKNQAIIGLQGVILDLQSAMLAINSERTSLLTRIEELQTALKERQGWETEKQRYQMVQIHPTLAVYRLRPEAANGEPVHHLCPHCFGRGIKSILSASSPGMMVSL